jgi:hypothetical protein
LQVWTFSQAIAQDFSAGRIVIKTMAFGSSADASKLKQLAKLGGGEFSAAVCPTPYGKLTLISVHIPKIL